MAAKTTDRGILEDAARDAAEWFVLAEGFRAFGQRLYALLSQDAAFWASRDGRAYLLAVAAALRDPNEGVAFALKGARPEFSGHVRTPRTGHVKFVKCRFARGEQRQQVPPLAPCSGK